MNLPACFIEPDSRPESARFADEVGGRPDEVILITRDEPVISDN
jgi:hypothetical protein